MHAVDQVLLRQWVRQRDAEAFQMLANRHSGMVYATCLRILRSPSEAEEVAQECFEALVRAGDKPGAYLGAWLYRVATNLAIKRAEANRSRANREIAFSDSRHLADDASNEEYYGVIDEAIAELPEKLRYPIVAHFLENQTHEAIASTLRVSRQTVTYRIGKGIESIRACLKKRGVTMTAAALSSTLVGFQAEAAPPALSAGLGKLALGGPVGTGSGLLIPGGAFLAKAAIGTVLAMALGVGVWASWDAIRAGSILHPLEIARGFFFAKAVAQNTADLPEMSASPAQDVGAGAQHPVNLDDPEAVWSEVLRVNSVWLTPRVQNLSYILKMGEADPVAKPEITARVWCAGDLGRCEEVHEHSESNTCTIYAVDGIYGVEPLKARKNNPYPKKTTLRLRQGTVWRTAFHVLAERGLPEGSHIVDTYDAPEGRIVVMESPIHGRIDVGLGVGYTCFGQSQFFIDRVRIHVRTTDFVPVLEEDFSQEKGKICEVRFGPNFIAFGDQAAPAAMTYHPQEPLPDGRSWTLKTEFQKVDGVWLLSQGANMHGDTIVKRIVMSSVSTMPVDPALFVPPTPDQLVQKDAEKNRARENLPEANPEAPRIIHVFPEPDTKNVPSDMEFRIRFDRPMNPRFAFLKFQEGGFLSCGRLTYNPDTYEFVLPARLILGTRYTVDLNWLSGEGSVGAENGFESAAGVLAAYYQWGFDSAALPEATADTAPKVLSVSPADGSAVACLSTVTVTFDRPMLITGVRMEKQNDVWHSTSIAGDILYDLENRRCVVPVALPPDWEGEILLSGFTDEKGVPADPIRLRLNTRREQISSDVLARFRQNANNATLKELLQQVQSVRAKLESISETVSILHGFSSAESGWMDRIQTEHAAFRWQGDRRFYGDVSDVLSGLFVVGSDGSQCWWRYGSIRVPDAQEDKLIATPAENIQEKNVSIANALGLQGKDIAEVIAHKNLAYLGETVWNGKQCYQVQSTEVDMDKDSFTVYTKDWWIDAKTYLPVQYILRFQGFMIVYRFDYDAINRPIPDAMFAPPQAQGVMIEPLEPLGQEYDTYFLDCADGSDGQMAVRWGKRGPKATSASGLH